MVEVVIGDVHARAEVLRSLLEALGVIDSQARRRKGFWVVQVGDLLDRRARPDANLATARVAAEGVDVVLAGNHEVDILAARGSGHGPALATLAARGWPQAAAEVGGWIVTHAGIHPEMTHGLPRRAGECAAEINDLWHRRSPAGVGHPLFDWVGPARGGISPYGGLFSRGSSEWPPNGRSPWGQICGHAPQAEPRLLPGPRWLIDLGSEGQRLAALVRRERSGQWSPVVVKVSGDGVALTRPRHKRAGALAV